MLPKEPPSKSLEQQVSEWQDCVFDHIVNNPVGRYTLIMPRRHGKTTLLKRLEQHFFGQAKKVNVYCPSARGAQAFTSYPAKHDEPDVILMDNAEHHKYMPPVGPTTLYVCTMSERFKVAERLDETVFVLARQE